MGTPDETFLNIIGRINGEVVCEDAVLKYEQVVYRAPGYEKNGVVATLDTFNGKDKFLWVNWAVFYLPFLTYFNMKESEITEMIKKHLDVQVVCRYPSAYRLYMIDNIEKHMQFFELLDGS